MKVELHHIHKRFGPVHANNDISLTVGEGTIFGLLGENGAGKSTLMKVLSGFIAADGGQIVLDGRAVRFTSPADALRAGVGMLHQDPLDFPPLRLVENFMTGRDGVRLGRRSAESALRTLCRQFDFDLDPDAFVSEITVGERQQLEIVRLLWLGARTLILDEPTTGISAPQKVKLFDTLRRLAADGKSIIFVSHKLEDVEALCHEVAVLRQGQLVAAFPGPFATDDLVRAMFGQVLTAGSRPPAALGDPVLQLDGVTVRDDRLAMERVSLTVAAGEVIGIAGLEGSGQRLLMQACAGLLRSAEGTIRVDGADLTHRDYHRFAASGVAFMPADRMTEGLVPGLTLAEHGVLAQRLQQRGGRARRFIDRQAAAQDSADAIAAFNIKGRPDSVVESLSGGNQQRALLALLPPQLRVLIMEHPTRGLDVESAAYIWGKLLARRAGGTCILFSSADLDEIFQYSDRILVCFNGQVTAVLNAAATSTDELGYLIGGKRPAADGGRA